MLESSAGYGHFCSLDSVNSHFNCYYKVASIKRPSETIYFADAYEDAYGIPLPLAYDFNNWKEWKPLGKESYHIHNPDLASYRKGTGARRFAHRHFKSTVCGFYEGHVSAIKTETLDNMIRGTSECLWDNM